MMNSCNQDEYSNELKHFHSLITNAEKYTKKLASKDLIKAFKISLSMIEKLGEMIHRSQTDKDPKLSDSFLIQNSPCENNSIIKNIELTTEDFGVDKEDVQHQANILDQTPNSIDHFDFFCLANNALRQQQHREQEEPFSSPQNSSSSQNSVVDSEEVSSKRQRMDPDVSMGKKNLSDTQNAELRHWRVANADKLNALIDDCEKHVDGRKVYKCKFCAKVYEIKSSMRYHMKIIHLQLHLKTTEMQCRICGKQFTCISAVNRHQSKCSLSNNHQEKLIHSNGSKSFKATLTDFANERSPHSSNHEKSSKPSGANKIMNPILWANMLNQNNSNMSQFSSKFLDLYGELASRQNNSSMPFEELLSNLTTSLNSQKTSSHNTDSSFTSSNMAELSNLTLFKTLSSNPQLLFSNYLNSTRNGLKDDELMDQEKSEENLGSDCQSEASESNLNPDHQRLSADSPQEEEEHETSKTISDSRVNMNLTQFVT